MFRLRSIWQKKACIFQHKHSLRCFDFAQHDRKKACIFQHKHILRSLDFARDDITIWNDIIVQHDRSIVFFYLVCYKHNPRSLDFARDDFVIVILKVLSFRACREISDCACWVRQIITILSPTKEQYGVQQNSFFVE